MNIGNKIPMSKYREIFGLHCADNHADINKIQAAYDKAWECRNFEINKFWSRAAFFWAFIALSFGAYGCILAQHANGNTKNSLLMYMRLELLCILGGISLSVIWLQSIRASKIWQNKWEAHIESLEDYICGPLYKTVITEKKSFPSISKLAQSVSIGVIAVWTSIFMLHACQYWNTDMSIDWIQIIMFAVCCIFIFFLIKGKQEKSSDMYIFHRVTNVFLNETK